MPADEAGSSALTRLAIVVRPNARASGIVSYRDQVVRVDLAAPPVDGRANTELIQVFARVLRISRSGVRIIRGGSSRHKLIEIDLPAEQITMRLHEIVSR